MKLTYMKEIDRNGRIVIPSVFIKKLGVKEYYLVLDEKKQQIILSPIKTK